MKYTVIAATLAAGLIASVTAAAGEYNYASGIISRLETFGDDLVVHGLDLSPNPAGCDDPSSARLQPSLSAAQKEGLGRILTAAFTAGRPVKVKLSSTECSGDRPAIYAVRVE